MSFINDVKNTVKANAPAIKEKTIVIGGSTLGLIITSAIVGRIRLPRDTVIIVPVDSSGEPTLVQPTTAPIAADV